MDVYSVSSGSSAYDTSATQASIDESYDMFLTLLTTQLQNQNPTDPMDSDKITEQFLNYSSIEQQVMTNDMLASMLQLTEELQNGTPTDYLGNEVTITSAVTALEEGEASWDYTASSGVESVTATITDSDGKTVHTRTISSAAEGENSFSWDGIGDDGTVYEDGLFTLSLTEKVGNESNEISGITTSGTVEKVDWSSGSYILTVDGQSIASSQVKAVATAG